ncbi:MAG: metallophosphoesterase [Thermodesulfobacteriota bacterium]
MRIYAVADIHGRKDRFALIRKKAVETGADLIVMAGDIAGLNSHPHVHDLLKSMPAPVFYVRGNSDRRRTDRMLLADPLITHLHLNKVRIQGLCFAGISGTFLLPFSSRLCLRENRLLSRLNDFFNDVSVLVTHPPPRGTVDRVMGRFHSGSSALRALTLTCQPCVVICGHIHEHAGTVFLGRTLVVNCSLARQGAGALIEFRNGDPPEATMLGV